MSFWSTFGWPLLFSAAMFLVYFVVVKPRMSVVATVTGKANAVAAAPAGFQTFWATLNGWKTHILALIAGLAQMIALIPQYLTPDLVKEWQTLPWASVLDTKTANLITLACAFLIPITHSIGLVQAAKTPPQS